MRRRWFQRWPEVRGGLIALAIVVGLVDGCPIAPPQDVPAWQREIVEIVRPVQHAVLTPFRWVTTGLRFTQRWALFQVAKAERFRFEVLARGADGTWSMIYRASDPTHAEYASILSFRRIQGAWNPTDRTPAQYLPFVHLLARRVLDDHPEFGAVRARFEKVVLDDGQVTGTGVFVAVVEHGRGAK